MMVHARQTWVFMNIDNRGWEEIAIRRKITDSVQVPISVITLLMVDSSTLMQLHKLGMSFGDGIDHSGQKKCDVFLTSYV